MAPLDPPVRAHHPSEAPQDAVRRSPVSSLAPPAPRAPRDPDLAPAPSVRGALLLAGAFLALLLARPLLLPLLDAPGLRTGATVFVALVVQAMPFLVLGVLLSAALTAFVPDRVLTAAVPRRPVLAVPAAGAAGLALPGCECASVPLAGGLVRRGVAPAAALAFLLSAPAVNPVVLVATAVAFPGQPEIVAARALASLLVACVMGWLWLRLGRRWPLRVPPGPIATGSRGEVFRGAVQHDVVHAGGFLVVGAAIAAAVNVAVPTEVVAALAAEPVLAVLVLAVFAVVVAICSEADAFVAASLSAFSPTAQLAFMVVGPAVDVKLVALQAGTFGRGFAMRFAPLTFVVAVASASLVGWWLL